MRKHELVREYLLRFPNHADLTMAKKIYAENSLLFNSVETVRSCIRGIKGTGGRNYKDKSMEVEPTYKDPDKNLALREAGCQGSYMPYGKAEIARFFVTLVPHLFEMIANPPMGNMAICYAGNLNNATALNLPLSAFASSLTSQQILIQPIS